MTFAPGESADCGTNLKNVCIYLVFGILGAIFAVMS